jgi:multidrug efflux pump subunit AcrB
MWIVRLALNRPYTFVVMALAIILLTPVALLRTPTDIFPDINIPVVSMVYNFAGMEAQEIESRITSNAERSVTTTVNDVEHMESQSLPGIALIKIFFQPSANIQTALAQVTAVAQFSLRQLPPGISPPLIVLYSASTVPVLQLSLTSDRLNEQQIFDQANNFIRTQLATVQGAAAPFPYGGRQRLISVDLDPVALQAKGLTAVDVVNAMSAQNLILPTGTAKLGPTEYAVDMNGSPLSIDGLNDVPIKTVNGAIIYVKEVAHVRDGSPPQTNIVRTDGRRGVLMSIYKTGAASTLDIVSRVQSTMAAAAASLPPDLHVESLFDQSIFVRAAVQGVLREALIAACLTAMMILLFLGDWRSTLIIAISIPLSIMVSIITLSAFGETINIMTLGGLALAVGILVDDATVAIENIDRNLALGKDVRTAILDGSQQISIPALVSTLCICIVFVPMFLLSGVAKFLFVPLAEAVIFAMLASYVLSRTLVPTMALYLLKPDHAHATHDAAGCRPNLFKRYQLGFERLFEAFRQTYRGALGAVLDHPKTFASAFMLFCLGSASISLVLGRDFFPQVDAGQIRLHMRGPTGLRVEETARLTDQVDVTIRQVIAKDDLVTILDNVGMPNSSLNLSYGNAGPIGTSDAEILVQLSPKRRGTTGEYTHTLRALLADRFPGTQFFFQPADIVTQILNFGLPAPIDVEIIGANQRGNYELAEKLVARLRHVPGAVDVHVQQAFNAPALHIELDRSRAQALGLTAQNVAQNLLLALSSSSQTAPTFWLDPGNGVSYNVAVQMPQYRMESLQTLANLSVAVPGSSTPPQMMDNLVAVTATTRAEEISHYNVQPMINVYGSVDGRDLGAVADDVSKEMAALERELPRGSHMLMRGQVQTMATSFAGLAIGLVGAIVLAYLLIVVNFQSWLDPFIIITALPGALAGILWMLLFTHTTLNVPSLTGAIMCMGVATANSILLVSFARERMGDGLSAREAALDAGFVRIRPVLMTAAAMIIGMIPMAIGLGEGGEQNAPLGRAVVGGLLFATLATLLFVPSVFTILHGWMERRAAGRSHS